jgi:hypothetical protein
VVLVSAARICKELADPLVAMGYEMESNIPEQFATFPRADAAQWLRLTISSRPATTAGVSRVASSLGTMVFKELVDDAEGEE